MNYTLEEIIDIPLFQELQDKLNRIYSFPSAIIDNNGKVLTAVAWQEVCTKFHRIHPQCEKECIKSDQYIIDHIKEANPAVSYKCPHGLIDNATPIIIDGKHLGNFFTGQFFLEKPDLEFFKQQANKFGFNEKEYIEAVNKVPIWTKEKLSLYLDFIKGFIEVIAGMGLKNLKEIETNKILKENEERNNAIIQSTSDWIWEIDKNGKYIYCSERVEKILGYTSAEMIGKSPFDFISEEESQKIQIIFNKIVDTKSNIVDLENWNIHKDGHRVCILTNGFPVFDNEHNVIGYRGADKDITDRKISEENLQNAYSRLRGFVDSNIVGVIIATPDGEILEANNYYLDIIGYSREELNNREINWRKLTPSEWLPADEKAINEMRNTGKCTPYEKEYLRRDGTRVSILLSDALLQGKDEQIIAFAIDITKRKEIERELIESKAKYQFMVENTNDILWTMNPDFNLDYVSPSVLNFLGYTPEEHLKQTLDAFVTPESAALIRNEFQIGMMHFHKKEFDKLRNFAEFEIEYIRKDKVHGFAVISMVFIRDNNYQLIKINGKTTDITDRKRIESKLKESELKYRSLIENTTDVVFCVDEKGEYKFTNNVFANTFGKTPDYFIGKTFWDIYSKEEADHRFGAVKEMFKTGEVQTIEVSVPLPDKTLYFLAKANPIKDETGKVILNLTTATDITERKISENKLKQSEEDFRSIFESSSSAIAIIEPDTTISMVNDEYLKISGYTREEVIGMSWTKQIPPEDLDRLKEYNRIRLINPKEAPDKYEFTFYRKDGEIRHSLMSVSMIENKNKIVASFVDITEKKIAEKTLKESEETYRALFEGINDAVFISEFVGETKLSKFIEVNDIACKRYGYTREEFLNLTPFDINSEQSKKMIPSLMKDIYKKNHALIETEHVAKDGRIILVEISTNITQYKNKTVYHSVVRDITERKLAEAKLKEIEELFSLFMQYSPVYTFIKEVTPTESKVLQASENYISMIGISGANMIGKTMEELFPPEFAAKITADDWSVIEKGMVFQVDENLNGLNYTTIKFPIEKDGKNLLAGFTIDITERVQAEQMLQDVISNNPLSIQIVDEKGHTLKTNNSFFTIFGAIPPQDFSIFNDLEEKGLGEYISKAKNGEIVHFPDICYDVHNALPEVKSNQVWIKAVLFPIKDKLSKITNYVFIHEDITDRKLAEAKLREKDIEFRKLSANVPDLIFQFTRKPDGKYVVPIASEGIKNIFGCSPEDVLNDFTPIAKVIHPEDAARVIADIEFSAENLSYFTCEFRVNIPGRSTQWIYSKSTPEKLPDGSITWYGFNVNITKLKRIEVELLKAKEKAEESERNLLEAQKTAHIGHWEWNLIKQKLVWSDEIFNIFGVNKETFEVSAENFEKTIHPDDLNEFLNKREKGLSKDNVINLDHRIIRPNGEIRFVHEHSKIIRDNNGKNISVFGTVQDITEQKNTEKELQKAKEKAEKSESLIQLIINNFPNANATLLDKNLNIIFTGGSEYLKYGFSPIDLKNKHISEILSKDNYDKLMINIEKAIKGESSNYEVEYKDNIFYMNYVTPVKINEDEVSSFLIANINITDLKQTQFDLIKAKEKAEESDRLKSAFLANMSHEIRTPMNGILGFADLLKSPKLSGEKQLDYIKIIEESGNRMLNIINDIINISKVEAGLMEVSISETDINEQMNYIYSFFKPEVEGKGLKLIMNKLLPNDKAIIRTDSQKLNSILTNLLKNAVKFTTEGYIEIGYTKKSKFLEFFVKDTGIGILSHQKELVFERFRQGSEQLNRKYEGSGLGLSISKAYVEMMGGKIWIKKDSEGNSNEKGSEFYFTLPYNPVSEQEKEIVHESVSVVSKSKNSKKLKVLIVEDDKTSMEFNKATVEKFSNEILFAVNGNEAVVYCKQHPDIDLILMDIRLPYLDGYEAAKQIRQFNNKVIIIAQTAFALSGDKEKAIKAGCNDYLSKPYNQSMLSDKIMKYFF